MRNILSSLIVGLVAGVALMGGGSYATTATHHAQVKQVGICDLDSNGDANNCRTNVPRWLITPCAQEDSNNCYWDAGKAGNGRGHSFYAVAFPGSKGITCVMYWQPKYAKHHNYCS